MRKLLDVDDGWSALTAKRPKEPAKLQIKLRTTDVPAPVTEDTTATSQQPEEEGVAEPPAKKPRR